MLLKENCLWHEEREREISKINLQVRRPPPSSAYLCLERVFSYNVAELFSKFAAASLLNTLISPFNYCVMEKRARGGEEEIFLCMEGCRRMEILKIINLRNKIENSI